MAENIKKPIDIIREIEVKNNPIRKLTFRGYFTSY